MDRRSLISYSLLLCAISIGVRSSDEASRLLRSSDPTSPTKFANPIADSVISETKHPKHDKRVLNSSLDKSNEDGDDVEGAPPDHVVPYSPHEDPEEPSTKPKYTKPGDWAKPSSAIEKPVDFVPTKLYAQVRETHTVKRLPREEALKAAETAEEIRAAPRLREVVSKSKSNTVYTEEGYEDAAYDHAGHVRDADFHEGYASKLDDQRRNKKGEETSARTSDKEDIKLDESDSAEELNDYEDEYRNNAESSSRIEKTSPKRITESDEYEKLKDLLKNSDTDPKQATLNGIEKLEADLSREYVEAEDNTEKDVPENLKAHGNNEEADDEEEVEDDDDDDEAASEDDGGNSRDYARRMGKKIGESETASRAMLVDAIGKSVESRENEIRRVSSSAQSDDDRASQRSAEFAESNGSEKHADELLTTPDYGKLFWDYYKTDANIWQSHVTTVPNLVTAATSQPDRSAIESLTSVPSFPSVESNIGIYDTFSFNPPSTASSVQSFAIESNTDSLYPSATAFYESWKRRDRNPADRDSFERGSFASASSLHPTSSDETAGTDSDSALNLRNGQSATTLIGPKKLSYTVIIRSSDKTTPRSAPCDQQDHSKPEESNFDEKRAKPGYSSTSNQFDEEIVPETEKSLVNQEQDLTVIRPPWPVPFSQSAFADFPSDPYRSVARPSVNQESGHWQFGQETNGELDGHRLTENPDDYRLENHVGHAPKPPRVRHHRGPSSGRKRNHYYPLITKLVPPSPASRSKYAEYSGLRRNSWPNTRYDDNSRTGIWPELVKFYRLIDDSIFGRRRRRSVDETTTKGTVSNSHEKVVGSVAGLSRETDQRHERNFDGEETNRLVAASQGGMDLRAYSDHLRDKSSRTARRKRRSSDDLFDESPRITEEVINAEIKSRFEDDDDDDDDEESTDNEEGDSLEKERAKIEVEVPDFNFTEVIDSNERHRGIETRSREAETLDPEKYPFYADSKVSRSSALKYITNPRQVPRKTLGGTEFYDSRDRYLECADVEPDLKKVVPEEEEPDPDREQRGDQVRLRGLGEKLDCFRAKYFDENPLDNPLFMEKQVGEPRIPEELDPAKFASRITGIASDEAEEWVSRRLSRKPEVRDLRRSGSKVNQVITRQTDKKDRKHVDDDGSSGRERSRYHQNGELQRERGRRRRPTQTSTQPPELPVTPYQREVYEDVMGTIKNLAGMYQTFGESVQTPSIQPNINHLPSAGGQNDDWAFPVVHITQRPRGFMIRGMLPPQQSNLQTQQRHRIIPYRTNKVSYNVRPRIKTLPGEATMKVGYFKTVRVHKRSLDDERVPDSDAEESRSIAAVSSAVNASEPAGSERIIYTIRDRIRHSKPRGDFGRNGKFTNLEAAGTEDVRRREPRYDRIRRKKVPTTTGEPATTSYGDERQAARFEGTTVSSLKKPAGTKSTPREDFLDEPGETYKIQYSTPQRREARPSDPRRGEQESLRSEDHEEEDELNEGTTQETQNNNYDVREDIEEDVVTPAPAIVKLQKYLESDPPGYSEAFDDESTEAPERSAEEGETQARNSQTDENDEEDEERDEQVERPSESNIEEESSPDSGEAVEKPDSPDQSESYRNSDDDDHDEENDGGEDEKEDSPREDEDGEKEFMRFASRPYSPFESYEDPKYSDLGPRLAKPSFHHPSFSKPSSSKYRTRNSGEKNHSGESNSNSSEEESGPKRSRYVFPWEQDEAEAEDAEESERSPRVIDRYEYPWEKRERLARERRRKRKEREKYEKLFRFSDSDEEDEEEDEQDASHSEPFRSRVYPWEHYEVPTKSFRRTKASLTGKNVDNDEMGSEYRPVRKFSSRYKSRRLHPNDEEDPIAASGADPREIRVSIIKSIETASKEKGKSRERDRISNSTSPATLKTSIAPLSNRTTSSANSTTPSINSATPIKPATPSTNSTTTTRKSRVWKSRSSMNTPSTTTRSTLTTEHPRVWRVTSSTTKKPARSRKRMSKVASTELPKSERNDLNALASVALTTSSSASVPPTTTASAINRRTARRRSQSSDRSSSTTTTARPARRRSQTSTKPPEEAEASTLKTITERTTTPNGKTVEHRSRFSKEEIITKTSYPQVNPEDADDDEKSTKSGGVNKEEESPESNKSGKVPMRVEKVSIVTKETPEHIYRKEEIDKDGVKGMFVSITPNNGTNSAPESNIDAEDKNGMLRRFANSDEDDVERNTGEGIGGAFVQDVSLLPRHQGVVHLSEHGSKSMISSISWIIENRDY